MYDRLSQWCIYDAAGRVTQLRGGSGNYCYTYSYHDNNELHEVAHYDDNVLQSIVTYDAQGVISRLEYYSEDRQTKTVYFYDALGRMSKEEIYKMGKQKYVLYQEETYQPGDNYRKETIHDEDHKYIQITPGYTGINCEYKKGLLVRENYYFGVQLTNRTNEYTYDAQAKTKTKTNYGDGSVVLSRVVTPWDPEKP